MTIKPRKPFKLWLKETLNKAGQVNLVCSGIGGALFWYSDVEVIRSYSIVFSLSTFAFGVLCFYAASKLKPKRRRLITQSEIDDWRM
ncbi:hypothetical protein [Cribrihabitans neustonicus]|uniref:hypothetical protein n=1 Tax=Cribrihabitans neustonicus TaxID=1429085 RepID=UPI003B5B8817